MPLSRLPRKAPIWIEPEPIPDDFDWKQLHDHRLIASLLYRRGVRTADEAAHALDRTDPHTLDISLLPNIDPALERTVDAIDGGEQIGIFGDYDADGITSVTLLTRALRSVTEAANVHPFVPDRSDGYGVSERGVRLLADQGCSLLIAVDTGTNDIAMIDLAMSLGMDVIVLDHHEVSAGSEANAGIVVNPKLDPDGPYHELVGVGIAWMFVCGLLEMGYDIAALDGGDHGAMLDLVALGTVTDVGALRDANRMLVHHGMERLHASRRPGVRALARFAEVPLAQVTTEDISFRLGPRLNASGRVASASAALAMMMADDDATANRYAQIVERANAERKSRTDHILRDVAQQLGAMPDIANRPIVALYGDDWATGLVGPVASKVVERLGCPAIIMHHQDGVLTGSARSCSGVNLLNILDQAAPVLTRYGGHAGAGGLTLNADDYASFVELITTAAADPDLHLPQTQEIRLHAWLTEPALTLSLISALDALAPFGHGNPFPTFGMQGARLTEIKLMGKPQPTHLKLIIGTRGKEMEAILWGGAARVSELEGASRVDLAGKLGINTFNGVQRLQMILEDFRVAG